VPVTIVKVVALSARLKAAYQGEFGLEIEKARALQRSGEIRIVQRDESPSSLPVNKQFVDPRSLYLFRKSFTKKEKRIAWIQDFSRMGGAELSNCAVVKRGAELGYDIVGVHPSEFKPDILVQADAIILNNLFEFSELQYRQILWELFEHRKPYVKYDHDLRELKRLNKTRSIFERSKLNIFISPMHRDLYKKEFIYGDALPLGIDISDFAGGETGTRLDQTLIPVYHKGRGNHSRYMSEHKRERFIVIDREKKVPYQEMLKMFKASKKVVHLPEQPWAGDRVYFEAILSGCEIVANDNVGHKSWNPKCSIGNLKIWLDDSITDFWKKVEGSCFQ